MDQNWKIIRQSSSIGMPELVEEIWSWKVTTKEFSEQNDNGGSDESVHVPK